METGGRGEMRETTTDGEGEENVRRRGGREGSRCGQVPDIAGLDDLALDDDALDDALSDAVGEVQDRFLFLMLTLSASPPLSLSFPRAHLRRVGATGESQIGGGRGRQEGGEVRGK